MYLERVIVGGGIVGRMASYLTHIPIIEAGKPGIKEFVGLHYLHPSKGLECLLMTMDIKPEVEEVRSGIVWWREPVDIHCLTQTQRMEAAEAYCNKTRRCWLGDLAQDDKLSIMDGIIEGRELMRYHISFDQLNSILYSSTHGQTLYGARVESVAWEDRQFKIWDSESQTPTGVCYGSMIVTAPLKQIINAPTPDLEYESSYYYVFALRDDSWLVKLNFDYLYLVGSFIDGDRISFPYSLGENMSANIICVESMNKLKDEGFDLLDHMEVGKAKLVYSGINKYKRLIGDASGYIDRIEDSKHSLIGRYARWDNSLLVSDVADKLMEVGNERN